MEDECTGQASRQQSKEQVAQLAKRQQSKRSALARMAGNIASGLVTLNGPGNSSNPVDVVTTAVHLAEEILALIEERHPS